MNNQYFAYIRVSTVRQGQKGVSLQEQKDAIDRYATRESLVISEWFEEQETAAKRGRTKFNIMLDRLRAGEAIGVLIHKIDRGARNLGDWANLGELLDAGIEVKFVTESLDLASRGGRLSADIQAVVAADYVRNLREETRKGVYGRLKQGLYPLSSPVGYLDNGGGKLKTIDPERAPFVRDAFKLYSTGGYTLDTLSQELRSRGFRSRGGRPLLANRISELLNNPFYTGIMRIRTTGEVFPGRHEPLIEQTLFDRVQDILHGRVNVCSEQHAFKFKRLLQCATCMRTLTGERQRGHVYYRCHSKTCRGVSIREEAVDDTIRERLLPLQLSKEDAAIIEPHLPTSDAAWHEETQTVLSQLRAQVTRGEAHLERLTDALIERLIDRETYDARRNRLLSEVNHARQECEKFEHRRIELKERIHAFIELWQRVHAAYVEASDAERRNLLLTVSSNRLVYGKTLAIELQEPFVMIEKSLDQTSCCPSWNDLRTLIANIVQTVEQ
tara:strand:+ start:16034 stop:17530 length:1497 start_codon:yes stop_codon:yes gene_type:complete